MPADLLEAPPSEAHDVFKSVENFDTSDPRPSKEAIAKQESPTTPETKGETVNKDGQVTIDKPEAMKEPKKAKTALEKVGEVKKPEVKVEEKVVEPVEKVEEPKDIPALRKAYNLTKAEAATLKAELDKVKPDYEQIKTDLNLTREELTKLKAANLDPEERTHFDSLREQHARFELEQDKGYQEKIMAPILERVGKGGKLDRIAAEAKLDPAAVVALRDAMDLPDELDRNRKIRQIFKGVELEPDDFTDYYTAMTSMGRELNDQLYPAMEAKQKQAIEIEQAARTKGKQQAEEKVNADKAEFQKEREFVKKHLTEQSLKLLMEDTDLSVEGTTLAEALESAEAAESTQDKAYQAHAGAAMPFVLAYTNKLLAKIHELEEGNRVRTGSGTSRSDALVKTNEAPKESLNPDEVFKSVKTFGSH